MQFTFGSGVLIGTRTDIANPTPRLFGILQESSVDFALTNKELVGSYQFPVAVARGTGKIGGKAKAANLNAGMLNDLFFQGTQAANEARMAVNEVGVIPTTPFQITPANAATFLEDMGVFNATTGRFMTRVASGPVAGQYSVNTTTGVYLFSAADQASAPSVYITYRYTFTTTIGQTMTINNQLLGINPTFSIVLNQQYNGKQMTLKLNACTSTKLTLATKLEDFLIPEFDFSAYADLANVIGTLSIGE